MKLNAGFLTHESGEEHITVTAGNTDFNGLIRSNRTAGFIIECLKENVTKEQIIERMLETYDVEREQVTRDVEKILSALREIGAIDD